MGLFLKF